MAAGTYFREPDEYRQLIAGTRSRVGERLVLPVLRLDQGVEHSQLFIGAVRTDVCHLLFQRLPRDYTNPEGIQRALKPSKISQIEQAAREPKYTAPGSMIVTVETRDRPWVEVRFDASGKRGELVVDLDLLAAHFEDAVNGESLEEERFKIGYMIDAHHRTEGHYRAQRMDLELNTTFYLDLERKEMARVFAAVNEKQEKPSPVHTLAMRDLAGILEDAEQVAVNVIKTLNDQRDSVLYLRIRDYDGRLPSGRPRPYVNMSTFARYLTNSVIPCVSSRALAQRTEAVEFYFTAWKRVFPEAWADQKEHVLVKAMGFSIMCELFEKLNDYAGMRFAVKLPTADHYEEVIKHLRDVQINLGNGEKRPLDWSSSSFGALSSGKGINHIVKEIHDHLTQAKALVTGVSE